VVPRELIVVAIGGNSLIRDEAHRTIPDQWELTRQTCGHVAALVEAGYRVVLTHGNGPQVGFILRRSELARHELHPVPLDSCDADTQGAIGYMVQQSLHNEFRRRGLDKQAVALVTQVEVDAHSPAFTHPSKPIGAFMDESDARRREAEGWAVAADAGRGFRRVVPSPEPLAIVELPAIRTLVEAGYVVIAAGGGGIPVTRDAAGEVRGVEAVIDKDLASSLLARSLGADALVISTSVERVCLNYGRPDQVELAQLRLADARRHLREGQFGAGSMAPKIEALARFLEAGGRRAIVTSPENLERALQGEAGTEILPS
jgi:carbamate kinase